MDKDNKEKRFSIEDLQQMRKEQNTEIDKTKEKSYKDGRIDGILVGIIFGMIIFGILVFLGSYFTGQTVDLQQEACFKAVGDYKRIATDSQYYCVKRLPNGETNLYKLINFDNKWKVSREVTSLDAPIFITTN